jgi:CubicO group peptidase (beta-lactamase class C family)
MKDTTFWPAGEQLSRVAKSYQSNKQTGELEALNITQLRYPLDDRTRQPMPAGGLFSTARDMGRFCQMVAAGGTFEGRRYLRAAAVAEMTRIQTGELKVGDGQVAYAFGWSVRRAADEQGLAAGAFGHSGAYKTLMWIDPKQQRIFILLRQHSGDFVNPEGKRIEREFIHAAVERFK